MVEAIIRGMAKKISTNLQYGWAIYFTGNKTDPEEKPGICNWTGRYEIYEKQDWAKSALEKEFKDFDYTLTEKKRFSIIKLPLSNNRIKYPAAVRISFAK